MELAPAVHPDKATCLGVCSVEAPAKHACAAAGGGAGVDLGQCSSAGCMTGLRGRGAGAGLVRLQATPKPVVREIWHTGCPTTIYALRQGARANGWPMNTATCRCDWHCHSPPFRAPVVLAGYRHCGLGLPLGNADAGPARVYMRPWHMMRLSAPWPWPQCAATCIATAGRPEGLASGAARTPGPTPPGKPPTPAQPNPRPGPGPAARALLGCGVGPKCTGAANSDAP